MVQACVSGFHPSGASQVDPDCAAGASNVVPIESFQRFR